jgi:hypothetical protein
MMHGRTQACGWTTRRIGIYDAHGIGSIRPEDQYKERKTRRQWWVAQKRTTGRDTVRQTDRQKDRLKRSARAWASHRRQEGEVAKLDECDVAKLDEG